jgi:hypothetical protein
VMMRYASAQNLKLERRVTPGNYRLQTESMTKLLHHCMKWSQLRDDLIDKDFSMAYFPTTGLHYQGTCSRACSFRLRQAPCAVRRSEHRLLRPEANRCC